MIVENNISESGKIIFDIIKNKDNFFIGRMPGIEVSVIKLNVDNKNISEHFKNLIQQNTGFYCNSVTFDDVLKKWCELYLKALRSCDLLYRLEFSTWDDLIEEYYKKIYVFSCASLHIWLPALEGKKVLAISPFEESIKIQFSKREHLFTTGKQNNFKYPDFNL